MFHNANYIDNINENLETALGEHKNDSSHSLSTLSALILDDNNTIKVRQIILALSLIFYSLNGVDIL